MKECVPNIQPTRGIRSFDEEGSLVVSSRRGHLVMQCTNGIWIKAMREFDLFVSHQLGSADSQGE
jgi:hypothetical protein